MPICSLTGVRGGQIVKVVKVEEPEVVTSGTIPVSRGCYLVRDVEKSKLGRSDEADRLGGRRCPCTQGDSPSQRCGMMDSRTIEAAPDPAVYLDRPQMPHRVPVGIDAHQVTSTDK